MNDEIAILLTHERWIEIQEMAESMGLGVEEFVNVLFDFKYKKKYFGAFILKVLKFNFDSLIDHFMHSKGCF